MPGGWIWTLATGSASTAGGCVGGVWLGLVHVLWGGALFFATPRLTVLTAVVVGATTYFGSRPTVFGRLLWRQPRVVLAVVVSTEAATSAGAPVLGPAVEIRWPQGRGGARDGGAHVLWLLADDGGDIGGCRGRRRWSFVATTCGCVKQRWWWRDAPASAWRCLRSHVCEGRRQLVVGTAQGGGGGGRVCDDI
jgi:hypothetical protein